MKSLFTTILLASFTGIAVFGVFGMNHSGMQGHDGGCIAATAQGIDCPKQASPTDYAAFHLNAFREFSLATLVESVVSALLFAFASLLFIGLTFFSPRLFKPSQLALYRHRFRDSFSSPQKQQLTHWLAFHENSPSVA